MSLEVGLSSAPGVPKCELYSQEKVEANIFVHGSGTPGVPLGATGGSKVNPTHKTTKRGYPFSSFRNI